MPDDLLDPEHRLLLARAAFDALDRMLALAPQQDSIPYHEISAQVHLIRAACPCATPAAPKRRRNPRQAKT